MRVTIATCSPTFNAVTAVATRLPRERDSRFEKEISDGISVVEEESFFIEEEGLFEEEGLREEEGAGEKSSVEEESLGEAPGSEKGAGQKGSFEESAGKDSPREESALEEGAEQLPGPETEDGHQPGGRADPRDHQQRGGEGLVDVRRR